MNNPIEDKTLQILERSSEIVRELPHFCIYCGKPILSNQKFCLQCGKANFSYKS